MDYREAGVDIEAGQAFIQQIRKSVESTFRPEVLSGLGGFSGYFELPSGYQNPVLVSGTDGVGTKLKIAQAMNFHQTIGIDLVAMSVNDVLTSGAEPLFFLDYLATGKLLPQHLVQVVEGIVEGCRLSGCALLGGETAEMPGFYQLGEYDLAGFCVGVVEKERLLNASQVAIGDMVIGLASSGLHSNGFSLVRKLVATEGLDWNDRPKALAGQSIGEALLTPTRIYVDPILRAIRADLPIHAMAHITGGGLSENLPRSLNSEQSIKLNPTDWTMPPIFRWIKETDKIDRKSMRETFNLGIGFAVIASPETVDDLIKYFATQKIPAYVIGRVVPGNGELQWSD